MNNRNEIKDISKLNHVLKVKIFCGIILFRIVMDFIYSEYISSIFWYDGFFKDFRIEKYFLSWLVLLVFIPIIIRLHKEVSFSSVILILLGYLSIVPFTTMIAFYPFSNGFIIQNTLYWLILFSFYKLIPKFTLTRIKGDKLVNFIIATIIAVFLTTIIYISWRYTRFRLTINIFDVYGLRREVSSFNLPSVIAYIYSASKFINPILMVYFLHRKNNVLAFLIFATQILTFSIDGSKTVLFSIFLAVILYRFYSEKYLFKLPWLLGLFGIVSSIEIIVTNSYNLINFIIRRVLFVPNLLGFCYFDFFSVNTPDYFMQGFLRHFGFQSKYRNIVYLIGDVYFNKPNMSANNGLISDAYANLGWLGLIIMPFLIILSLRLLDACSKGLNIRIFIVSAITMTFVFISSFFFTILITHGFIAICLILYLLPREYELD